MPIRKRVEDTTPYVPSSEGNEPVVNSFDPAKDPFDGSTAQQMGMDKYNARAVLSCLAYGGNALLPSKLRTQDLLAQLRLLENPGDSVESRYRDRIRSPLTAIRSFCVECSGGSPKEANHCIKMECPVWPFRMGQNSFHGRK